MKHVATVRGYNNHFFFVDQDRNSDVECIFELVLYYEDNEWHNEKAVIYQSHAAELLTIKLDYDSD